MMLSANSSEELSRFYLLLSLEALFCNKVITFNINVPEISICANPCHTSQMRKVVCSNYGLHCMDSEVNHNP
jgi:hypothetical protein